MKALHGILEERGAGLLFSATDMGKLDTILQFVLSLIVLGIGGDGRLMEGELTNGRLAMLAVPGTLLPEFLGKGPWFKAAFEVLLLLLPPFSMLGIFFLQ